MSKPGKHFPRVETILRFSSSKNTIVRKQFNLSRIFQYFFVLNDFVLRYWVKLLGWTKIFSALNKIKNEQISKFLSLVNSENKIVLFKIFTSLIEKSIITLVCWFKNNKQNVWILNEIFKQFIKFFLQINCNSFEKIWYIKTTFNDDFGAFCFYFVLKFLNFVLLKKTSR